MNIKGILLSLLFVISLATAGLIVAKRHPVQNRQPFTLYETQGFAPADGSGLRLISNSIRYQKSDGSWRKDATYSNGRTDTAFAQAGRGVFHVDEKTKTLDYLSGPPQTIFTEDLLRNEPGFVGEQTVLDFKTFHIRRESTETGETTDNYLCAALQGYPLKRVTKFKNGAVTSFEVTRVVLGEPPEGLFTSLPGYQVDYEKMKH
jgi:hypothetical protein